MSIQSLTQKLAEQYINKLAYVYIRQSTRGQVKNNIGSQEVQKAMYDKAIAYGFPAENIKVLIKDQARSATVSGNRDGFNEMLIDIAGGTVGAVFCSHSSRLSRNGKDTQQLLVICETAGTLIIDENGKYDPRNDNDHFFLNIKWVFDEADGRRIKAQTRKARLALASKGHYRIRLPTGYVWAGTKENPKIVFEPDMRVQESIKTALSLLPKIGTLMGSVRFANENGIQIPTLVRSEPQKGKYIWEKMTVGRLGMIYHDPIYAGSYVFGQYQRLRGRAPQVEVISSDIGVEGSVIQVSPADWMVHLPNNHTGYITLGQFEQNRLLLKNNKSLPNGASLGAARSGAALLTGLVYCSECDLRMNVMYPKKQRTYYYRCPGKHQKFGNTKYCQYTSCIPVDEAVSSHILQALTPSRVEVVLEANRHAESQVQAFKTKWQLLIEDAKSEAAIAEDRFKHVNPRNRLVAETLESEWEEKEKALKDVLVAYEVAWKSAPKPLDNSQQERIRRLAEELPKLWNSDTGTPVIRKRILRLLIEKVALSRVGDKYGAEIHWRTGARTTVSTPVRKANDYRRTDRATIELINRLAQDHTDSQIVKHLNEAGIKTQRGLCFTLLRLNGIRPSLGTPITFPAKESCKWSGKIRPDGRCSTPTAAKILKITRDAVTRKCVKGEIDAIQYTRRGPWWIKLPQEVLEKFHGANE